MNNDDEYDWLRMPSGEKEFPDERWHKLTFGGLLWNHLTELVRQRAPQAKFEQVRKHLEDWRAFAESGLGNKEQWERACRLVELAQQAVDGLEVRDEQLDRGCFRDLSAWEWDAFCAFRGGLRSAECSVTPTALLIDAQTGNGVTAQLTLERLPNGFGHIYASPQEHAFLTLDEGFEQALKNAEIFVKTEGTPFDTIDVRWRLQRHDGRLLTSLGGPSIGGTFAMGCGKLLVQPSHEEWGALELNGVGLTAAVDTAGNLSRIGGLWEKLGEQTIDLPISKLKF